MASKRIADKTLDGLAPAQLRRIDAELRDVATRAEQRQAKPGYREEQAAKLRAVFQHAPAPESFDYLMGTPEGRSALEAIALDSGEPLAAIKYRLDTFDVMGGHAPHTRDHWTKGGRRGIGAHVTRTEIIEEGGIPTWSVRLPEVLREQITSAIALGASHIEIARKSQQRTVEAAQLRESHGLKPEARPAAPKTAAVTPEAIRKREARAAGRVKARPSRAKPPRTLAQEVESRRMALATHEANLQKKRAAHAARPDLVSPWEISKAEEAVRRARKTLDTYERRQAETSPPAA